MSYSAWSSRSPASLRSCHGRSERPTKREIVDPAYRGVQRWEDVKIASARSSNDPFFIEKVRDIVGLPPDHAVVL